MFCAECGSPLEPGIKFCPNCGAKIPEAENEPEIIKSEPEQATTEPVPVQENEQPAVYQPAPDYSSPAPEGENAKSNISFTDAIALFFRRYTDFRGRSGLTEFWYAVIMEVIVTSGLSYLSSRFQLGVLALTSVLWGLATIIPGIAVSVRRLHDTGRKGTYLLIGLIPLVGWIILIIAFAGQSAPDNEYGPAVNNNSGENQ